MALQVMNVPSRFKNDGSVRPIVVGRRTCSFDDLLTAMGRGSAISGSDMLAMWDLAVREIMNRLNIPEDDLQGMPTYESSPAKTRSIWADG
mgnify:CR=1 FL=1|jgi:hypothetical protein